MGKTSLVTGAAGFLGFAVLQTLRDRNCDDVTYVKAFDLGFPDDLKKQIENQAQGIHYEWISGDITDAKCVQKVVSDCDVVIHLAGIVPGVASDDIMWKVNVQGTQNVVNACVQSDVTRLVFISSLAVIGPNLNQDPAYDLEEDMPYHIYPMTHYGKSKREAEHLVLETNGRKNRNGEAIATCALRPPSIYGPNSVYLHAAFKSSYRSKFIPSFTSASAKNSMVYVGNMAWAILLAAKQIQNKAKISGGRAYFIKDDTPDQTANQLFKEVFPIVGIIPSKREPSLPFWLLYFLYSVVQIISDILRRIGIIKISFPHRHFIYSANTHFTVSNNKFIKDFGFQPIYSYQDSLERCRGYLKRIEIEGKSKIYDLEL